TYDLGDRLRERVAQLLRDGGDLGAYLRGDIAFHEVVYVVEANEGTERRTSEVNSRVDQQLLCQLDDGPVSATDVPTRAALRAKTGHDLDDEVDLVRQQRVQVDEAFTGEFGQPDI